MPEQVTDQRQPLTQLTATAWTGGHQSLLRLGLGLWLLLRAVEGIGASGSGAGELDTLGQLAAMPTPIALLWLQPRLLLAVAVGLTVGLRSRSMAALSALLLAGRAALLLGHGGHIAPADAAIAALLTLQWLAPAAPYGSWDARGRLDPGGGWRRPAWHAAAATLVLAGTAVGAGLTGFAPAMALALLLAGAAAVRPAWVGHIVCDAPDVVFYDGHCGLCHRTVRWLLAEDPDGTRFRYAALDSATLQERVAAETRATLPDSVVVLTWDGRLLTRFAAVRYLLARLGGAWRVMGAGLALVPLKIGDLGYEAVAKVRHRIFAAPAAACPLLPPTLRARMLP